jgi:dihydrofolate synthase/folylpolyglutamate synthase
MTGPGTGEQLHPKNIDMGLECAPSATGCKSGLISSVITVVGTNGKGSTCAMLESILLQAGYRRGLHLTLFIL